MKETIHQWADKFLKSPVQEMSKQTATMFVQVSIGIPKDAPLDDVIARSEGDFGVGVLAGRVKAIDLDITGQAFALIRVICDSPGSLVMWALALRSWQLRHGNRQVRSVIEAHSNSGQLEESPTAACGIRLQANQGFGFRFVVTTATGTAEYLIDRFD